MNAGDAFSGLLMNSLTVSSVRLNLESFSARTSGLSRSILSMIWRKAVVSVMLCSLQNVSHDSRSEARMMKSSAVKPRAIMVSMARAMSSASAPGSDSPMMSALNWMNSRVLPRCCFS